MQNEDERELIGRGDDPYAYALIPADVPRRLRALALIMTLDGHYFADLSGDELATPTRAALADRCGVSVRTIDRWLRELVAEEVIEIVDRFDVDGPIPGAQLANGYRWHKRFRAIVAAERRRFDQEYADSHGETPPHRPPLTPTPIHPHARADGGMLDSPEYLPAVTLDEIMAARSPRGSWTLDTFAGWGMAWPPRRGWKRRLAAGTEPAPVGNRRLTKRGR